MTKQKSGIDHEQLRELLSRSPTQQHVEKPIDSCRIPRVGDGEAHKPTQAHRDIVSVAEACDVPRDRIAKALGITRKTLEKVYADELAHAKDELLLIMRSKKARIALDDNNPKQDAALTFFLERLGGMARPPVVVEGSKDRPLLGGAFRDLIGEVMDDIHKSGGDAAAKKH
jgi:hypothetical protein